MDFWGVLDSFAAGSRVACDKTWDYASYYWSAQEEEKPVENLNDSILDYNNVLTVEKYNDEKDNKRIFPTVGYYEAASTFVNPPTHIIENIYLGGSYNAASYQTLKDCNITTIMNITKEISNYFPDDFEYVRYDIYDNNVHSIQQYLEDAFQKIQYYQKNREGNILIHCHMGASRSATVIIYYLMKTQFHENGDAFTFEDALEFVKNKRPIINPTFRFTKDLAKSVYDNKKTDDTIEKE